MKKFLEKIYDFILLNIKGWKTIASASFMVMLMIMHYVYHEIPEDIFDKLIGAGGFAYIVALIEHFVKPKEIHSPDPPQGNQ